MGEAKRHALAMPERTRLDLARADPTLYGSTCQWLRRRGKTVVPGLTDTQKRELVDCFHLMDLDNSGAIDVDELETAFELLGINMTRREAEKIHKEADKDGTGVLEYAEYCEIMTETLKTLATRPDTHGKHKQPLALMSTAYRRKHYLQNVLSLNPTGLSKLREMDEIGFRPWQAREVVPSYWGKDSTRFNRKSGAGQAARTDSVPQGERVPSYWGRDSMRRCRTSYGGRRRTAAAGSVSRPCNEEDSDDYGYADDYDDHVTWEPLAWATHADPSSTDGTTTPRTRQQSSASLRQPQAASRQALCSLSLASMPTTPADGNSSTPRPTSSRSVRSASSSFSLPRPAGLVLADPCTPRHGKDTLPGLRLASVQQSIPAVLVHEGGHSRFQSCAAPLSSTARPTTAQSRHAQLTSAQSRLFLAAHGSVASSPGALDSPQEPARAQHGAAHDDNSLWTRWKEKVRANVAAVEAEARLAADQDAAEQHVLLAPLPLPQLVNRSPHQPVTLHASSAHRGRDKRSGSSPSPSTCAASSSVDPIVPPCKDELFRTTARHTRPAAADITAHIHFKLNA